MVLKHLLDHYDEGGPLFREAAPSADTASAEGDSEVVAAIKEVIETRVRPAVQDDGGDIFFVRFDEDVGAVHLRMAGACVGCASSTLTLRNGVESMLRYYVPEVESIVDTTDHGTGAPAVVVAAPAETLEERLAAAGVPEHTR